MMKPISRSIWQYAALAAALAGGCSDYAKMKPPATYRVRGKVVWSTGAPLPGGRITFHPLASASSEACAEIERDGTFALATFGKEDGAMPGRYRISLDAFSYKTGRARQMIELPPRYRDPRSSGLEVEISEPDTRLAPLEIR
jgi:hypothetical protein